MKRWIIAAPLVATLIIWLTSCGWSSSIPNPTKNQQVNSGNIDTTQLPWETTNTNPLTPWQSESTWTMENPWNTSTTVSWSTDVKTEFWASKDSTLAGSWASVAVEKPAVPKAPEKLAPAALEKIKQKWEGEKWIKLNEKQINDIKQYPGYVPAGDPIIATWTPQTAWTTVPIPQKK